LKKERSHNRRTKRRDLITTKHGKEEPSLIVERKKSLVGHVIRIVAIISSSQK